MLFIMMIEYREENKPIMSVDTEKTFEKNTDENQKTSKRRENCTR